MRMLSAGGGDHGSLGDLVGQEDAREAQEVLEVGQAEQVLVGDGRVAEVVGCVVSVDEVDDALGGVAVGLEGVAELGVDGRGAGLQALAGRRARALEQEGEELRDDAAAHERGHVPVGLEHGVDVAGLLDRLVSGHAAVREGLGLAYGLVGGGELGQRDLVALDVGGAGAGSQLDCGVAGGGLLGAGGLGVVELAGHLEHLERGSGGDGLGAEDAEDLEQAVEVALEVADELLVHRGVDGRGVGDVCWYGHVCPFLTCRGPCARRGP